ncbi:MAG: hypothetical protein KC583_12250, partial [Myxococcales bacterium]|nr:hypothetical protein [Myxococcales bacterium]
MYCTRTRRRLVALLTPHALALALMLTGSTAFAQNLVKPKMLVVFDSSGSMTWTPTRERECVWTCALPQQGACYDGNNANGCPAGVPCLDDLRCAPWTYGDGSLAYPGLDHDGNGLSDDSRMYIAKEAMKTTLFGTSELEFGLMRYAQDEGNLIRATGRCSGCDAQHVYRSQYDAFPFGIGQGAINYDGQLISCQRGGEVLVPIANQTGNQILSWMDHDEDFPYSAQGDRELRGDGNTPIAGSLRSALAHFRDTVIPADPRQECRSYFVLLLTDGEETCEVNQQGLPNQAALETAARDLLELQVGGRPTPVRTFVIGFGDDTIGSPYLQAIAEAGGTGQAFFATDRVSLQLALAEIVQAAIPQESCNGLDDDCDGQIDENLLRPCDSDCGQGTETCVDGRFGGCTAPQPEEEVCDAADNDCDGLTDEGGGGAPITQACQTECGGGQQICVDGVFGRCDAPEPRDEVCNNLDDDCDGETDEDVVRACSSACGVGQQICNAGVFGACDAPRPQAETCDGTDQDCDGNIDEAITRPCQSACGLGTETCNAGQFIGCTAPLPQEEICDGRDNDCDGSTDEELSRACQTACGMGTETCTNGRYVGCTAQRPEAGVCDGQDNDCDGEIDDGVQVACQTACGQGVRVCAAGSFGDCTAPTPQAETCNGVDDDCYGRVDE